MFYVLEGDEAFTRGTRGVRRCFCHMRYRITAPPKVRWVQLKTLRIGTVEGLSCFSPSTLLEHIRSALYSSTYVPFAILRVF